MVNTKVIIRSRYKHFEVGLASWLSSGTLHFVSILVQVEFGIKYEGRIYVF